MAKLRNRYLEDGANVQPELFSRKGFVLASEIVHRAIFNEVSSRFGKSLRHINEKLLLGVLRSDVSWYEKVVITSKGQIYLDVSINQVNISDVNNPEISVFVHFPVYGKNGELKSYLLEVLNRVGIEEGEMCGNYWEVKVFTNMQLVRLQASNTQVINHDSLPIYITQEEYIETVIGKLNVSN